MFGTLNHFNKARGFGFIRTTGGTADVYFHFSEFEGDETNLVKGVKLEFEMGIFKDRPCARSIRLLEIEAVIPRTSDAGGNGDGHS
jgi:CspA family cold shock protein